MAHARCIQVKHGYMCEQPHTQAHQLVTFSRQQWFRKPASKLHYTFIAGIVNFPACLVPYLLVWVFIGIKNVYCILSSYTYNCNKIHLQLTNIYVVLSHNI